MQAEFQVAAEFQSDFWSCLKIVQLLDFLKALMFLKEKNLPCLELSTFFIMLSCLWGFI